MKPFRLITLLFVLLAGTLFVQAQKMDYAELGKRIVNTSADIQPGDVVVVAGGKHTIDLMEAVAIEARKQGGFATMFLTTDAMQYSLLRDVPDEYLGQESDYFTEWFKEIDVWIGLPAFEDFQMINKDVPKEKYALLAKAGEEFNNNLNNSKVRAVFLAYPTEFQAKDAGLDFKTWEKMAWNAINADYSKIAAHAKKLEKMLMQSKEVHITSPAGTDLTFSVSERTVLIDDGVVAAEDKDSPLVFQRAAGLPGGQVVTTIHEDSAEGKLVVAKTKCNYEPIKNMSLEFENGVMQNLQANDGQDCMMEIFKLQEGDYNKIAGLAIGLNPALKVMQDGEQDLRSENAAGMVYVGIGDNRVIGGNNKAKGNFSYDFPVTNATVTIDGVVVVKDGVLQQ